MLWGGLVLILVGALLIIAAIAPGVGYALVVIGAILAVVAVALGAAHRGGPPGSGL